MIRKKYWLFILAILLLIWLPILGWAQVTVSLPADVKGEVDDYAFLPITVGNLTGLNALSYEFTVTYDKNVVEITGYDAVGTLSEGMSIVANTTVPGQVKVAAAGTNALVGSGTLLNLKVKYVGSGSTDLTWEKFMFNEGTPTASPVNGHITVGAIDVILPTLAGDVGNSEIFPITVSDLTGKNVLSYEFTITFDKNVVKITGYDAVGTLSEGMSIVANTTVPGQIKVAAAGTAALSGAGTLLKLNIEYIAEGSSDLTFANFMFNEGTPDKKLTNGKVNIGRIDLILPETKGNIGETGLLPIMVEDLTGKDVLAYEFTVTYDKSVVEITGYDAVGTLSEDMSIVANTTVPGQIKVAAAGTTALVGSGTLLNLKVKYVGSGRTDLTWEKFMFNEGTPSANTINGSVSGNLPPVFVKVMPDTTISEGQALDYTYTATDADGDTLTFSLVNPPVGAKINSTSGVFSWTPSYEQSGTYNIVAVVTDGIAKDTSTTAVVVVSDVNRAPVFVKVMPDTTISEGQALSYTYTATDADGDTLTFSLVNPPVGAKINSTSGVFSWTPSYEQSGTYNIVAVVTDGIAKDTSTTAVVVVSDVNRAPVFVKVMPDTTISEGQALSYTYTATDADGNTLTFSLVNPPVGAKINSTSGVFSWTPSKQIGTYQIIISLTDGIVTVNDTASVHLMVVTPEGNLTLNPEFNDGLNNWTGFASAPGAAAITLDDTYKLSGKYSMRVNVTAQGSNIWDIQRMTPLPIETGYTYNISYYAVADKDNAKVRFVLEMADSPYTAYLDTTIYIMTEPQLFEFVLKKNTVNEPTTMLKWQFGQPGSVPVNIWIDAVFATRVKDVAIKDEPSIPDEFILSQNYPNPFNPTTNITFGLPKESNVTIDVYNLMGQKVATLVNERINAGYHTVNWNGRDASGNRVTSGVYIYKITAGDFAKSKKMLLVK